MFKVSIIIPVYNVSAYLRKCLDSVCDQTYSNLEVIVVNDGSKDSSLEIIKEYVQLDTRIQVIDQVNGGVTVARKNALKFVSGDFVLFVDGDDSLPKNAIESLMITQNKYQSDIVFGNYTVTFDDKPSIEIQRGIKTEYTISSFFKHIYQEINYNLCTKLFKRELFDNVSVWPPRSVVTAEDLLILIQLVQKAKVISRCSVSTYYYYQREGSAMNVAPKAFNIQNSVDFLNCCEKIYSNYVELFNTELYFNSIVFRKFLDLYFNTDTSSVYKTDLVLSILSKKKKVVFPLLKIGTNKNKDRAKKQYLFYMKYLSFRNRLLKMI